MARIISNTTTAKVEAIFNFVYDDKVKEVAIQEDQIVKVLYVRGSELTTSVGRVSRIIFDRKPCNPFTKRESLFSERYRITELELDCSQINQSTIIRIPVANIIEIHDSTIEDDLEQANLLKVHANLIANISVVLSDGTRSSREVREGDAVSGLIYARYTSGPNRTTDIVISGTVKRIKYVVKGISTNSTASARINDCVDIGIIEIQGDSTAKTTYQIDPRHIKNLGKTQYTIVDMDEIEDTIAIMNDDEILKLPSGIIPKAIYIDRSIYLVGAGAGVDACENPNEQVPSTVFRNSIKFKEGVNVYLDGCVFEEHAFLDFKNSKKVTITNSYFQNLFPEVRNGSMIRISNSEECTLSITHCCFESWKKYGDDHEVLKDNVMKHNIEISGPLKNSSFSDNYFMKGCCTSDNIAIFGIADNSSLFIYRNFFEYSGNGIWLGVNGNPSCSVYLEDNAFSSTPSDRSGLLRIQPHLHYTTSFENVRIVLNGNKTPDANTEIFYLFYDEETDTQITQSKVPHVFLNGVRVMKPIAETVMGVIN